MNPQNSGSHIRDRHSILWRKPMFYESEAARNISCRSQLGSYSIDLNSNLNSNWKSKNSSINSNYKNLSNSINLKKRKSVLDDLLTEDKNQSKSTKSVLSNLRGEKETLEKSKVLLEGIQKLKEMNLLAGKQLNHVKFPGIIRNEHVHNDYHDRKANPGYSRNYQGKIYTR